VSGFLDHERYYGELEAETAALAAAVGSADLAAPVPTCPQWSLLDLAWHVGRGQRWAALIVERRAERPVPMDEVGPRPPAASIELSAWLLAGARRLADAVRAAGPDRTVWTWSRDHTAGFWLRKLTHDTLIHRLDADLTMARDLVVAADLAADGISDLLATISVLSGDHPDPIFAGLRGDGETLRFQADEHTWLVRRTPAGVRSDPGSEPADVSVAGHTLELLLVLNRRKALEASELEVAGNRALLEHWLAHSAF